LRSTPPKACHESTQPAVDPAKRFEIPDDMGVLGETVLYFDKLTIDSDLDSDWCQFSWAVMDEDLV
jgi:hypothetical protein